MIVAAIDPGLKGGVAFFDERTPVMVTKMPKLKSVIDVVELAAMFEMMQPKMTVVERQSIRAGQGAALTIGANYGRILATLEICRLPYRLVTAAQWKKRAGFPHGAKGKEKQEAAYELARREFGDKVLQEFRLKVTTDGPVEAMLMGIHGL